MDPLSIATGCITLLTVVGRCGRLITGVAASFKDAQEQLTTISRELSDLDLTLRMLKDDADPKLTQLPQELRRRICEMVQNCNSVLVELEELLSKYDDAVLDRVARWALSGRKDAERIRLSLNTHKAALALVVEASTLHMVISVASDTRNISNDTAMIKEHTAKIVEQLAKQDQILEQIAWIKAAVLQGSTGDDERALIMDRYLDSMTVYAGSVYGDSVSEDITDEMRWLSLDVSENNETNLDPFRPSAIMSKSTPDPMTIVIGNTHRMVAPQPERTRNNDRWSFYLKTSGKEIIHEIKINLHPSFTPSEIVLESPPYRVTRIGWGYFTIKIAILLKEGYRWQKENSKSLELEWELDFEGFGSSTSYEYSVVVE